MRACVCVCVRVCACVCVCKGAGAVDCGWATGFNYPMGVALDSRNGALLVTNVNDNTVCLVPPGGGADAPRAHYY